MVIVDTGYFIHFPKKTLYILWFKVYDKQNFNKNLRQQQEPRLDEAIET